MKRNMVIALIIGMLFCFQCACFASENTETWSCPNCGQTVTGNFCNNCGEQKPSAEWQCPNCGSTATGNFCSNCGASKPANTSDTNTAYFDVKVGDYITFGHYEQDNDLTNGSEPIEWLVLKKVGTKVLVISKYGLDQHPYNTGNTEHARVTWEKCDLRSWLNDDFFYEAFSVDEQIQVETSLVRAGGNLEYSTRLQGNDTRDKVFLLSCSEADEYFENDNARICHATNYSIGHGAFVDNTDICGWWLRSPGKEVSYAAAVYLDGQIDNFGFMSGIELGCVRPAMWINLGSEGDSLLDNMK